jgi:hypothetical protein
MSTNKNYIKHPLSISEPKQETQRRGQQELQELQELQKLQRVETQKRALQELQRVETQKRVQQELQKLQRVETQRREQQELDFFRTSNVYSLRDTYDEKDEHTYLWHIYWFFGDTLFQKLRKHYNLMNKLRIHDFNRLPNFYEVAEHEKIYGYLRSSIEGCTSNRYDKINDLSKITDRSVFVENLDFLTQDQYVKKTIIFGALNVNKYKNIQNIVTINIVDIDLDYGTGKNCVDIICDMNNTKLPDWLGSHKFDTILCESIPTYLFMTPMFFSNVRKLLSRGGQIFINNIMDSLRRKYNVTDAHVTDFLEQNNFAMSKLTQIDKDMLSDLYKTPRTIKDYTKLIAVQ